MSRQDSIQLRRGTQSEWMNINPILANGELGLETNTGRLKIGNGSSQWSELDYIGTSENLIKVQNKSGYAIQKGQAVYINGYDSYSKVPTVSPYIANGTISEQLFAGLISDYVSNNEYAFILNFGTISNLITNGSISNISSGDENWSTGDVLYAHPFDYGKLTKFKPNKNVILVGIITYSHATSGTILVRSFINPKLSQLNEIYFNGISNSDLIKYDSNNSRWINQNELDGGIV